MTKIVKATVTNNGIDYTKINGKTAFLDFEKHSFEYYMNYLRWYCKTHNCILKIKGKNTKDIRKNT